MTLQETIALAESPKTCPETLTALYNNLLHIPEWRRSGVRKKIAGNPNIPAKLIPSISHWHGRELFKNPALPLLLMEAPTLFQSADPNNLYRLLSWEEAPAYLLSVLAQQPDPLLAHEARYHVALHPGYDDDSWIDEVKDALAESCRQLEGTDLLCQWRSCGALPSWLEDRLDGQSVSRELTTFYRPNTVTEPAPTPEEQQSLESLTENQLLEIIQHPGQHPERLRLLWALLQSRRYPGYPWQMKHLLRQHPNLPRDLAGSAESQVDVSYCDRELLTARLETVSSYSLDSYATALLSHGDADDALCRRALYKSAILVRYGKYPELLWFLAQLRGELIGSLHFWEPNVWWYRRLLAGLHPATDPDDRAYIAKDSHRWVRAAAKAAQSNPDIWKRFWE